MLAFWLDVQEWNCWVMRMCLDTFRRHGQIVFQSALLDAPTRICRFLLLHLLTNMSLLVSSDACAFHFHSLTGSVFCMEVFHFNKLKLIMTSNEVNVFIKNGAKWSLRGNLVLWLV